MKREDIAEMLTGQLNFKPTADQQKVIGHIAAFEVSEKENPVYILKGYAGTGKTSLISTYVKVLKNIGRPFALMAPTGRAAKVLAQYTGFHAHTIHRSIYQIFTSKDGVGKLTLANNPLKNSVFLVDEASMINDNSQPGDALFSRRNLLEDLLTYVFSKSGNKLILVGDTAQLPPVGLDISPALDPDYVKSILHVSLFDFEMKEVMRQTFDSGILTTATALRVNISLKNDSPPFFDPSQFKSDIIRVESGYDLEELLQYTFSGGEPDNGIVVCRSNKRANLFNQQIRSHILQRENDIEGGDMMMVVKNNYFWLDETSKAGFIANGDIIKILRIRKTEEMYGFQFADAEVQMLDYPEEKEYEVKLLLKTIYSTGPGLSDSERQELFNEVEKDYLDIPARRARVDQVMKNPYFNAVHVKFAYAMTCHKTQGGQWPVVIVDQGYVNDEMINVEYLRWLYTAITRSTQKLYLVNFKPEFFAKPH